MSELVRDIITDEKAFSEGMPFPPTCSNSRQDSYKQNILRYEGLYNKNKYIAVQNLNGKKDYFGIATLNYYSLITNKLQALLLLEKPIICIKEDIEKTKQLNDLVNTRNFWESLQQSFINFSSLGTGVLYLYKKDGKPLVNSTSPEFLYKVVQENDISEVKCYVLAQPIRKVDYKDASNTKVTHMRLLYHYRGYYIERVFEYESGRAELGKSVNYTFTDYKVQSKGTKVSTGLKDFAVFVYDNQTSAKEVYGVSDYRQIADLVGLYEQAFTMVNIVNVKNINPIVQVPYGMMTENELTGSMEFNGVGKAIETRHDDKDIKFISYDMQIQDQIAFLGTILQEISIQSETSMVYLTGMFNGGNMSGEAIKNLMKAPLDRISRSIDRMDSTIKSLFVQILHLDGTEIKEADVSIEWKDGIATTEE